MDRHILNNRGFSLLELSIVMGVIAILVAAFTPMAMRSMEMKAAEKTAAEITLIKDAARQFHKKNKKWPSKDELQSQGYLNPLWGLSNPWNNPYQINPFPAKFTVATILPNDIFLTDLVVSKLPGAVVAGSTVSTDMFAGTEDGMVPGIIVAWSGTLKEIPKGWALCDGQDGRPNLMDKFIVGASQDQDGYAMTQIEKEGVFKRSGGSATHDHGKMTGGHALTVKEMPAHSHGYYKPLLRGRYDGHSSLVVTEMEWEQSEKTGGNEAHSHPISSASNVPPYFALAYIMKLP